MNPVPPLFNPFPGLRPFETSERHLFFGREIQTAELVTRLRRHRFLAAVGLSGSGKSSLVRAGLLPELYGGTLRGAGTHWRVAVMRPGGDPVSHLAGALLEAGLFESFDADSPAIIQTALARSRLGMVDVVRKSRLAAGENLLVVVDQFEEVFRFHRLASVTADPGKAFVDLLLEASHQTELPIYIVITMRSDFLGDCTRYRGLAEAVNDSEYLVPRLTRDQWKQAIEGPIRVGGGEIAPRLTQRLLRDVADDPDQLPTLQHALMRAWDHWVARGNTGQPLDLADYEAVGGLSEALSRHADETYHELPDDRHRAVAERVFRALTDLAADIRGTRRPTRLADLIAVTEATEEEVRRVIEVFRQEGRAFLTPPGELDSETVIDLSHESLMRLWRRLRAWAETEAQSSRMFLRLADAAALWKAGQAGLHRDPALELALQWQATNPPTNAWAERLGARLEIVLEFLEASRNARAAEREAREAARRRELEQARQLAEAERRRATLEALVASRMRRLAIAMVLLALLAITFGLMARHRGQLARSRELAVSATQQLDIDPELSVLLAREAYRTQPTPMAAQILQSALMTSALRATLRPSEGDGAGGPNDATPHFRQVTFSADGSLVAACELTIPSTNEGRLWLWRPSAGAQSLPCGVSEVRTLAFSQNGRHLLTAGADGQARVWDVTGPALVASLPKQPKPLRGAAFSPDGTSVVTAGEDGHALLWDWQANVTNSIAADWIHPGVILDAQFTSDGQSVVTASEDGGIRWWRRGEAEAYRTHRATPRRLKSVAISPDSGWLAALDAAGQVGVFEVAPWSLALTNRLPSVATTLRFSPQGDCLVLSGASGAEVWHLPSRTASPAAAPQLATGTRIAPGDRILQAGFSPDGRRVYVALEKQGLRLWSIRGTELVAFQGHRGQVNAAAFSPDGRQIVSASRDGTLRLWDVEASLGRLIREPSTEARLEAVTTDGRRAVLRRSPNPWQLWSEAQTALADLPELPVAPQCAAFSPDGQSLSTVEGDQVLLRDARSGRVLHPFDRAQGNLGAPGMPGRFQPAIIAFSGDGRWLVGAGQAGDQMTSQVVLRWRVEDRTLAGPPRLGGKAPPAHLTLSREGEVIAIARLDQTIEVWSSRQTGPTVFTGQTRGERIGSIALDPDGALLAFATQDGSIWLWQPDRVVPPVELRGHSLQVNSMAWSRDGRFLASGSADGTVQLWSLERTTRAGSSVAASRLGVLRGFRVQTDPDLDWTIHAVALGENQDSVMAASSQGEIRQFAVPQLAPGVDLERLASQRLTRRFSSEEAERFGLR